MEKCSFYIEQILPSVLLFQGLLLYIYIQTGLTTTEAYDYSLEYLL